MSADDPKRMLDELQGGDLKDLLQAGRSELPNEGQMLGLAAKIGIVGGLGGLGGAGAAGLGGAGGAGAGAGGGAGAGAGVGAGAGAGAKAVVATSVVKTGLVLKVGAALTVASAVGVGAVAVSTREPEVKTPPAGIVASAPVSGSSVTTPSSATGPTRLTIVEPPSAEPSASHAKTKPSADTSAEAEVKLLERAQDALRTKTPAEALALCDEHARTFPRGMLVQERERIAIEALVKAGKKDDARARAERFKARFPGSSHTRRIEALVGE